MHTLHSSASDSGTELVNQVQQYILDKFDNYITNYTTFHGTRKMLLDCANYLLRETQEGGILTPDKYSTINKRETVISNLANQSVYDYLYGYSEFNNDQGFYSAEIESIDQDLIEDYRNEIIPELSPTINAEYRDSAKAKKWRDTKTYKMNILYSTKDKYIEVGDDDVFTYDLKKNEAGEWSAEYPKFDGSTIHFSKELIHESRNGRIPIDADYISNWSYIDTENNFKFNGEYFIVDKSCKQYIVLDDNESKMDHVLGFYIKDNNEYIFFDENIEDITKFVSKK